VLAIEMLAACRGLDLRAPLRPGPGVAAAYDTLRAEIPARAEDRPLAPEIDAARRLIVDGTLVDAAEAAVGPLAGIL
jgi:histidine ammonia-lyase